MKKIFEPKVRFFPLEVKLKTLRDERNAFDLEAISVRQDREHYIEEITYLEKVHLEFLNGKNTLT